MTVIKKPLDQYDLAYADYIEDDTYRNNLAPLIGEFLITFSELEHDINVAFSELVGKSSHDIGYTIIQHLNLYSTVQVLKKLLTQYTYLVNSNNKDGFLKFIREVLKTIEFRNKIAHANWVTADKDYYVRVKITSDKDTGMISFNRELLNPKLIKKEIDNIHVLLSDLEKLMELENIG